MTLLLDTHSFLWFVEGDRRLSSPARHLIEDPANERLLSLASLWEMAIKVSLGKLTLHQPIERLVPQQLVANRIALLDIHLAHVAVIARLPHHHRDPFDRMLVAQALVEQLPIVSADPSLDAYGVIRHW